NSSTGTRSRSATPDSLDSEQPGDGDIELANSSPPRLWSYPTPTISVVRNVPADRPDSHITTVKEVLRRQPSTSLPNSHAMVFRHPGAWGSHKGSLAGNSAEGIEMLYYQPIGTIHLPRPRDRGRSGSDPTDESSSHHNGHYISNNKGTLNGTNGIHSPGRSKLQKNHITVTRSHSNLYNIDQKESPSLPRVPPTKSALRRSGSHGQLGFEEICQQNTGSKFHLYPTEENNSMKTSGTLKSSVGRTWVEFLGDEDLFRLRPLLLLEVTALFDSYNITFNKRKTPKHKRKDGNVFGVPLAMLLAKDRQITNEECSIPLVFQKVLSHLEKIGVREEGILRVAGLQQKVETLYQAFEADFYRQPDRIEQLLQTVSCHDLAGLLKRLLRDLPQPLLTVEYIDLFYQCHDKNDLNAQVSLAATCCRLTETMLKEGDKLWVVPDDLIAQIRRQKEEERYRRGHKENSKPMKKLLGKKSGIREQIMRKIDNEVDFQDGVIRVNAPQFQMPEMPIQLASNTTAGDVVLRIVDEATRRADMSNSGLKVARRYHDKSRALAELAPNGNLSCILASGYPELTLQTHFLYEIGGNIAQRQVEPNANMMAVYKENPNTQWILRCHHRNGNNTTPVN
ncbi:Rho GTPase-activating protein conundrum, partial [Gryllus bimaculatus]